MPRLSCSGHIPSEGPKSFCWRLIDQSKRPWPLSPYRGTTPTAACTEPSSINGQAAARPREAAETRETRIEPEKVSVSREARCAGLHVYSEGVGAGERETAP
jgi:hypothetical protein